MIKKLIKVPNRDLIDRQCRLLEYVDLNLSSTTVPAGAICEIVGTYQGKFRLAWTQPTDHGSTTVYSGWLPRSVFRLLGPSEEGPQAARQWPVNNCLRKHPQPFCNCRACELAR